MFICGHYTKNVIIPLMKKALITGITGQDGSYLAELLLSKGYEVHGIVRRASSFNRERIDHLCLNFEIYGKTFFLHYGDMTDSSRLTKLVYEIKPDEVYNLAAQSHVRVSFDMPEFTGDVDALGTMRLLEAIRESGLGKSVRFYQASTSELYGKVQEVPQRETTPLSSLTLRSGKVICILGSEKLSRSVWPFCIKRYSFQPRIPSPRRKLRYSQDNTRCCQNQTRASKEPRNGQYRSKT